MDEQHFISDDVGVGVVVIGKHRSPTIVGGIELGPQGSVPTTGAVPFLLVKRPRSTASVAIIRNKTIL